MPKIDKERRQEIENSVRNGVFRAIFELIEECPSDKLDIDHFSMDMIARRAGLAKGTLYNYFKNKADLIEYVISRSLQQCEKQGSEALDGKMSVPEKLLAVARAYLDMGKDTHKIMYVVNCSHTSMPAVDNVLERFGKQMERQITRLVQDGIRRGFFRDIPADELVQNFIGLINSFIGGRMHTGPQSSFADEAGAIVEIFLHGAAASQA